MKLTPESADPLTPECRDRFKGHPLLDGPPRLFAWSRFLARSLAADEQLAEWVLSHPASRGFEPGSIAAGLVDPLADAVDTDALYRLLRRIRRRCMCLIAWADLAGVYRLEDTMAAVSELADTLIDAALERLYADLVGRHGVPRGADSGAPVGMVVLGLGKLGGGELNFSSDVDLVFSFWEGGQTDGPKALSNEEFFVRLGRQLVRHLDEPSAEGFVFRTDMRLRPNGASGPLALSFDAMEHYYQAHGRDWERYALIKARVVAGDRARGAELLELLRPFVYRKYLDFSAFESIREMKGLINRELERKGRRSDIKLGRGGIREIEFIVQSHQLIRGGREPALQTPSLYRAFEELVRLGVIDDTDRERLLGAYAFLRNTEHRLQMYDDMQTQKLPEDDGQRALLAESMGFADWPSFAAGVERRRELVQSFFSRLFQTDASPREAATDGFTDVWFGTRSDEVCRDFLAGSGFEDAGRALGLIRGIREGRVYQSFSRNGRERLDRMLPPALREIAACRSPDQSLVRFINVVEGIGRRSAYFALLAENPLALKQLIQLIGTSSWVANWIGRHPVILDELLDPISNAGLLAQDSIHREIERRLTRVEGDMEAQMDLLREFKNGYLLRAAALEIAGGLDPLEVRRGLSDLAATLIESAVGVAEDSLSAKVREPVEAVRERLMFGVVGYGKLGGRELSYSSDLDLVFLYHADATVDPGMDSALGYYYSRLAQRVMHVLSTATRAGVLYETDIRLRPSGRSGTMVSSLRAFDDYQREQAWTWEHQALVRARVVAGPAALAEGFERVRASILGRRREIGELCREVADMRRRMSEANCRSTAEIFDLKLGQGGIVDVEFLAQYHVLANAHAHPEIIAPRDTIGILEALEAAGILAAGDGAGLAGAYRRYLARELELKLQEQPALVGAEELGDARAFVAEQWRACFDAR